MLGALLADAATMPLHWIYDLDKLNSLVESKTTRTQPEFFPEPSCPFYEYPLGALSPYGDEAYAVLRYAATHTDMDGPGLTESLYQYFKGYQGRLNGTAKHLVAAWEEGKRYPVAAAEDFQAHAIVKVPIVVARYGGTPELLSRVEEAVRTQQDSQVAVAVGQAAALVLEQVVVKLCGPGAAVGPAAGEPAGGHAAAAGHSPGGHLGDAAQHGVGGDQGAPLRAARCLHQRAALRSNLLRVC